MKFINQSQNIANMALNKKENKINSEKVKSQNSKTTNSNKQPNRNSRNKRLLIAGALF